MDSLNGVILGNSWSDNLWSTYTSIDPVWGYTTQQIEGMASSPGTANDTVTLQLTNNNGAGPGVANAKYTMRFHATYENWKPTGGWEYKWFPASNLKVTGTFTSTKSGKQYVSGGAAMPFTCDDLQPDWSVFVDSLDDLSSLTPLLIEDPIVAAAVGAAGVTAASLAPKEVQFDAPWNWAGTWSTAVGFTWPATYDSSLFAMTLTGIDLGSTSTMYVADAYGTSGYTGVAHNAVAVRNPGMRFYESFYPIVSVP